MNALLTQTQQNSIELSQFECFAEDIQVDSTNAALLQFESFCEVMLSLGDKGVSIEMKPDGAVTKASIFYGDVEVTLDVNEDVWICQYAFEVAQENHADVVNAYAKCEVSA